MNIFSIFNRRDKILVNKVEYEKLKLEKEIINKLNIAGVMEELVKLTKTHIDEIVNLKLENAKLTDENNQYVAELEELEKKNGQIDIFLDKIIEQVQKHNL